jgi:hypothetical protein
MDQKIVYLLIHSEIFPTHRQGSQEDAHEMLTMLLDALEQLPPNTAGKQQQVQIAARPPSGPPPQPKQQRPLAVTSEGIDHQSLAPMPTPIEEVFGGRLKNESI